MASPLPELELEEGLLQWTFIAMVLETQPPSQDTPIVKVANGLSRIT